MCILGWLQEVRDRHNLATCWPELANNKIEKEKTKPQCQTHLRWKFSWYLTTKVYSELWRNPPASGTLKTNN